MYTFSSCGVENVELFWALWGFRVQTLKGLGLRFKCLNLKSSVLDSRGLGLNV